MSLQMLKNLIENTYYFHKTLNTKILFLTLSMLGKNFSRWHFEFFFLNFPRKEALTFQILFSEKI